MSRTKRGAPTSCELLKKAEALVGRGIVEGAFRDMVAGEKYAERVLDAIDQHLQKRCGRKSR